MKNSADQGGCYPQRPKIKVDNILQDVQNSSYPTKAEFNNCFIIHSKYSLKGENKLFGFLLNKTNTTLSPGFSVNASILSSGLLSRCHWFNMTKFLLNFNSSWL